MLNELMKNCLPSIIANPRLLDALVNPEIHPSDQMHTGNDGHYFGCGRDAIRKICTVLTINDSDVPVRILDFACGYGRVTRYLRAAFPDADIVASDVMSDGIEFTSRAFSADPHRSRANLEAVSFNSPFDLIWCGSLMTHLPEEKAVQLLELFERHLNEHGVVVFTTHGRYVAERRHAASWPYMIDLGAYNKIGDLFEDNLYSYAEYSHMKGYGLSLTPLSWLAHWINRKHNLRFTCVLERGWDNHQDIIALTKNRII